MRSFCQIVPLAVVALQVGSSLAADTECEEFTADQQNSMVTDVVLTYTWDAECGDDPELGPLSRDGEEIPVEWSHDLDSEPHEHTASDTGLSPGVHQYTLAVTPPGEDSYEVEDTAMVSGTEPADDDETDETGDDGGVEETESESSGGCSVAAAGSPFSFLEGLIFLF